MTDIKISYTVEGETFLFPLNPEEVEVEYHGNNSTEEIVSLGKIVIPKGHSLLELGWESYFPADKDPEKCHNFLVSSHGKFGRLVFEGISPSIDIYAVIEEYSRITKAGEEDDLYYSIAFKQYRPYGAKIVEIPVTQEEVVTILPEEVPRVEEPPPTPRSYTVVSGDSLWAITARYTGNGNRWKELYNVPENKETIHKRSSSPNLIYPGQVFILPTEW